MTLYEMASKYGREIELYGKSLYWSSPKTYPNTTEDLVTSKEFKALSEDEKYTILSYGSQRKRYGIGCYQERGGAQELCVDWTKSLILGTLALRAGLCSPLGRWSMETCVYEHVWFTHDRPAPATSHFTVYNVLSLHALTQLQSAAGGFKRPV